MQSTQGFKLLNITKINAMLLCICCNESISKELLIDLHKLHCSPNELLVCRCGYFLIVDENKHYAVSLVDTMEMISIQAEHSYKYLITIYVYYSNYEVMQVET